jgi:beta-propeller uncharacterized protein DUF5122
MDPIPIPPNALEGGEPRAARQSDGKTLVLWLETDAGTISTDVCLARLHADGTSDTEFGDMGFVRARGLALHGDLPAEVLVRDDGAILAIFNRPVNEVDYATWIAWFRPEGRLDTSRNHGGIAGPFNVGLRFLDSAALLPDGRIVLAGPADGTDVPGAPPGVSRMARLEPDGGLDRTFGQAGCGIVALTAFGTSLRPAQIVVAQDGTIFVTGRPLQEVASEGQLRETIAVMKFRAGEV